jgi:hypothetical protein
MQIGGNSGAPRLHSGVVLLGWMGREEAVRFLSAECAFDPPLTVDAANALWQQYRGRVATIPLRTARTGTIPLTPAESDWARGFSATLVAAGAASFDVVKIDPGQVVAGQYSISLDRARAYRASCATDRGWLQVALPASPADPRLDARITRCGRETDIEIDLPHAEFSFDVTPEGSFAPIEGLPHVAAVRVRERLVLVRGYHRLYARMSATSAGDRATLIAVESSAGATPRAETAGPRPALLSDFFNPLHALNVRLRAKRYRLEVRARWVATNADDPK